MGAIDAQVLLQPLRDDAPCGNDLEDTQEMAAIDAFRVFGQATPLKPDTDWRAIQSAAGDALATSKDFRLLAHWAAASLRLDGIQQFSEALGVAARWLELFFDGVYPRIDSDAILRKNALGYFADRMAVVDAIRRVPLVSHRQLGTFSLRHVELAAGTLKPGDSEGTAPTESEITAAFTAAPQQELTQLQTTLQSALDSLKSIETAMVASQGVQAAPSMGPLSQTLSRMHEIVSAHVRAVASVAPGEPVVAAAAEASVAGVPGQIRTREDAIRSLEAVSEFFRRTEPSSPVPLFVDRAKRLVARDFLEVLAELVPDSVSEVRRVGGIRDES